MVHAGEVHDTLVSITFPLVIFLASIITADMICLEGASFVAIFRTSQSTQGWDIS